jgi:hypothetical protein
MVGDTPSVGITVNQPPMQFFLLAISNLLGLFFAWIDSRPTWDDTGVLVGMIVLAAAILGAIGPRRPWLWALGVGVWIPLHNLAANHSAASLPALAFALAGAYAGAAVGKLAAKPT